MFQWKKLACAVDLSEPSRVAMEYAAALAKQLGAELTLVHVHAPPSSVADAPEKLFQRWCADAEALVGAPVHGRFVSGDPVTEIMRAAAESGCELLIVGTHSRAGLSRVLLGSVAERLVRTAPCPVFVARDRVRESASEAEEVAQYH